MSIQFQTAGPFKIPLVKGKNSTLIDEKKIKTMFWDECESDSKIRNLRNYNGCYIFGLQLPKNIVPYYVGKTWRGFVNETFKPYQVNKYNQAVHRHGTPVMMFVYKTSRALEGTLTQKVIRELEIF